MNTISIQLRGNSPSLTSKGEDIRYHQEGDWMLLTQPNAKGPDEPRQEFARIAISELVSIWVVTNEPEDEEDDEEIEEPKKPGFFARLWRGLTRARGI